MTTLMALTVSFFVIKNNVYAEGRKQKNNQV